MHRFIYHYFLTKLCYLQQSSGPCTLQWHNILGKSSRKDDVGLPLPHCQCSPWLLSPGTWACLALGQVPCLYLPIPPKLTLLGLWWGLAFALICLGFMPNHPSFNASRWKGKKLNNHCFLLREALLHFTKPFRDNSQSRRELTTCFTIIKLMQLPSLFRGLQLHMCCYTFPDKGPEMLGCVSAAVSSTSSYLLFFSRTQGIT